MGWTITCTVVGKKNKEKKKKKKKEKTKREEDGVKNY
jgi:hypothetical protein